MLVLDFEVKDAFRSRFVAFVLLLFALGAGLGALGFLNSVRASEAAAREMIAGQMGLPPEAVPMDQIKAQSLDGLLSMVSDPELRRALRETEPLALFFGYMTQFLVPGLVLFLTAGAHAADVASGGTRFVLFRVERWTWAVGKLLAQVLILFGGLGVAALVTLGCAVYDGGTSQLSLAGDLFLAALRPLPLGACYLGWFAGIALFARAVMAARALSVLCLFGAFLGHLITASDWVAEGFPWLSGARFLFPGEYQGALWRPDALSWGGGTLALLALGAAGFSAGAAAFARRDA